MELTIAKLIGIVIAIMAIFAGIAYLTNWQTGVYDNSPVENLNKTAQETAKLAAETNLTTQQIAGFAIDTNLTANTAANNANDALTKVNELEKKFNATKVVNSCTVNASTPSTEYNISVAEIKGFETDYEGLLKDAKTSFTKAKSAVEDKYLGDAKDARKEAKAIWDPSDETGSLSDLREALDKYVPNNSSLFMKKQELLNKVDDDNSKSVKDYAAKTITKVDEFEKAQTENTQPKVYIVQQQGNSTPSAVNLAGLTGY